MEKLIWSDDTCSVGVLEIDEQHKEIFKHYNNLHESLKNENGLKEAEKVLLKLFDYADFHFSTEEKYFKKFNYSDKDRHIEKHNKFKEDLRELFLEYQKSNINLDSKILAFLEEWIISHIKNEDKKYQKCFNDNGLT